MDYLKTSYAWANIAISRATPEEILRLRRIIVEAVGFYRGRLSSTLLPSIVGTQDENELYLRNAEEDLRKFDKGDYVVAAKHTISSDISKIFSNYP